MTLLSPDVNPDFKPPARIVDPLALRRAILADRECRGCGGPASEPHHIIFKSHGGDDVEANVAPLCGGDGSCHVRFHRDTSEEGKAIAAEIGRNMTPENIDYVLTKMGRGPGLDYLRRLYGFSLKPRRRRKRRAKVEAAEELLDALAIRRRARARERSREAEARRRRHGRPRG